MPVAAPIDATPEQLAKVSYTADGLVAAIVQDHQSGDVLMMAWMNADTLAETLETGRTVFWSRSRRERWRKGDTSGDRQWVRAAYYDCDGDALLFRVEQEGAGACHTGERSCFYRAFGRTGPTGPGGEATNPESAGARGAPSTAGTPAGPATAPTGTGVPAPGEGP